MDIFKCFTLLWDTQINLQLNWGNQYYHLRMYSWKFICVGINEI